VYVEPPPPPPLLPAPAATSLARREPPRPMPGGVAAAADPDTPEGPDGREAPAAAGAAPCTDVEPVAEWWLLLWRLMAAYAGGVAAGAPPLTLLAVGLAREAALVRMCCRDSSCASHGEGGDRQSCRVGRIEPSAATS
jgi:hypothetical protein